MKALARAWESSQRSTRDDWAEWLRHFAVVLLQESPSSALRATCDLALVSSVLLVVEFHDWVAASNVQKPASRLLSGTSRSRQTYWRQKAIWRSVTLPWGCYRDPHLLLSELPVTLPW